MLTSLLQPWRERQTWTALVQVVTTMPMAAVTFAVTLSLLVLLVTSGLILLLLPFVAWTLFAVSHLLASIERGRLAALADLHLADPVPDAAATGRFAWLRRIAERARTVARWKEIGYLVAIFPAAMVLGTITLLAWSGSAALVLLPAYVVHLPGGTAKLGLVELGPGPLAGVVSLLALAAFVLLAPRATRIHADLLVLMARSLLGPDRDAEHDAEVHRLESSRVAAVDTAEAERRRIERDLHDGAQQRLVALAVQLGAAQERLEHDPEGGKAMVAAAHREAKAALAELRDLVRGIHPVILEDRGLDAALSSVVARADVPVALTVDVDQRPPPPVESAAYFIVSEALTNVSRHAGATRATVHIVRAGDQLVIEVTDDGVGGADASRGTGLVGLQQRVAGLGGRMHLLSPTGGPTSIIVELPCAS